MIIIYLRSWMVLRIVAMEVMSVSCWIICQSVCGGYAEGEGESCIREQKG